MKLEKQILFARLVQASSMYAQLRYLLDTKAWRLWALCGISCAVGMAQALDPLLLKWAIDWLERGGGGNAFVWAVLLWGSIALFRAFCKSVLHGFGARLFTNLQYALLSATLAKTHRLPFDKHKSSGVGRTVSQLEDAISLFIKHFRQLVLKLLTSTLLLFFALFVMFWLKWELAVLMVLFGPVPVFIAAKAAPKRMDRERHLARQWRKIYARFNQVFSGLVTVKSIARADYEKQRFLRELSHANAQVISGEVSNAGVRAMQQVVAILARAAMVGFGGLLFLRGEASLGTLVAFLLYAETLFRPMEKLHQLPKIWLEFRGALAYIFHILNQQESIGDAKQAIDLQQLQGQVSFQSVVFKYPSMRKPLLNSVSFRLEPGRTAALAGPSGSGKSTLMALLQRFYDPDQGGITLDGHDLRKIKQANIRKHIGVIVADPLVFNESVSFNIGYGNPGATPSAIQAAAEAVNAHSFITRLWDGYESQIGEGGSRLSEEERQLIVIAREMLRNPAILLIDESKVKKASAFYGKKIQASLQILMQGRTNLIIVGRPQLLSQVDKVIFVQHGEVVGEGPHQELLQSVQPYADWVYEWMQAVADGKS